MQHVLYNIKMITFTWLTGGEVNVLEIKNPVSMIDGPDYQIFKDLRQVQYVVDKTWQHCITVKES